MGANFGGGWANGSLNIPGNNLYGGLTEFIGGVQAGYNIGQAFAHRLAQDGAHIVIADILPAADTVRLVKEAGRDVLAWEGDSPLKARSTRFPLGSALASATAISLSIAQVSFP